MNEDRLRVTWQFYEESFMWRDATRGRHFSIDRTYFDHYNLAPSPVRSHWAWASCEHLCACA
jgi:hypothetical protein